MTQANALLHKHTAVSAQLLEVLQLIEVMLSLEHLLIATLPNASFLHHAVVPSATLGLR